MYDTILKCGMALFLTGVSTFTYSDDFEPARQMPANIPTLNQHNQFKLNFAYSFDQEDGTQDEEPDYQHNLRFKLAWLKYNNQWLKDLNLETFQKHDKEGSIREQYLNSFKLAKYKNDFNYRFAKAQWEKDSSQQYDSLSSFTAGLGREFLLSPDSSFSGELGLGYRHNDTATINIPENEALTTAGLFYKHQFSPIVSYEQNLGYELTRDSHIFRGKSALNFRLNKNYFAQASYHLKRQDDLWNTHTDSRVSLGLEYLH